MTNLSTMVNKRYAINNKIKEIKARHSAELSKYEAGLAKCDRLINKDRVANGWTTHKTQKGNRVKTNTMRALNVKTGHWKEAFDWVVAQEGGHEMVTKKIKKECFTALEKAGKDLPDFVEEFVKETISFT